jgi:hypothetical protein
MCVHFMARAKLNTVTDIEREPEPAGSTTPTVPACEMAQPRAYTRIVLRWVLTHKLADSVAQVVRVESPAHIQEVARWIAEAGFVARIGSRIRAAIENARNSADRTGTARRSGRFLWHPKMREAPLRTVVGCRMLPRS